MTFKEYKQLISRLRKKILQESSIDIIDINKINCLNYSDEQQIKIKDLFSLPFLIDSVNENDKLKFGYLYNDDIHETIETYKMVKLKEQIYNTFMASINSAYEQELIYVIKEQFDMISLDKVFVIREYVTEFNKYRETNFNTIEEIIKYIIQKNIKYKSSIFKLSSLLMIIMNGFTFTTTKQGSLYWNDVEEEFYKIKEKPSTMFKYKKIW